MKDPTAAHLALPDVAHLRPHQQMAMECALCARPLGANGQRLGEAHHLGFPFQLWACAPACRSAG
ncbi:hypothetical protein ACFV0R_27000 [Streptomyces sp. NPDC059578]|uniref:hypothetical protein n=1 Tax=unclassified Streptomyces TaxID=2593676 RepID=UPI0036624ADC